VRRFYQESWQGIPFTSFSHISFFHLAEPRFYAVFYEELFRRYKDWDDLPPVWRASKSKNSKWLADRLRARKGKTGPLRVLSIGSGVGYMEKVLLDEMPELELHANEPSTVGMKWLRRHIPTERIYIGLPPACLPPDVHYDMIYLSAVDYGIHTGEMARLLGRLRTQLAPGGEIVCLSASLLEEDSFIGGLVNTLKIIIRGALH
jgi:phospholipid N-methyltransferase